MFNKLFKIILFSLIFILLSCVDRKKSNLSKTVEKKSNLSETVEKKSNLSETVEKKSNLSETVEWSCINDDFSQGQAVNVYFWKCIEGKQLVIKTSNRGGLFSTSKVSDSKTGLKIAADVSFKNKFYIPNSYTILKNKGDDREFPFLLDLLPEDEKFRGSLNTEYRIIFQTMGNYLVLFKAVKDLKDLPYVERTSLKVFRNGKRMDYNKNSYKRENGDYYMTPFIGYAINYCKATTILDQNKRRTKKSRLICEGSHIQSESYIKINMDSKKAYNYKLDLKIDFFPSEYFDGLWYFAQGEVEKAESDGTLYNHIYLVSLEREENSIQIQDMSGEVEDRNRKTVISLPVTWLDFEMAQNGGYWKEFGERRIEHSDNTKRPYAQINFNYVDNQTKEAELQELIIENDYLSYGNITKRYDKFIKYKTSFLKAQSLHEDCLVKNSSKSDLNCLKNKMNSREGFIPRRWFHEDHKHVFGFLSITPQTELQEGSITKTDKTESARIIKFNTTLNTEEEKKTKRKIIEWYFSKHSTKDIKYRKAAQEAVDIYNQAFAYLSKDRDQKIEVKLVQGEEKDLGDIRYNIINLIEKNNEESFNLLDVVIPSYYANPDTGQIIGATVNIVIPNQEKIFYNYVRNYIRYEIFQTEKRTEEENEIHVVTPYIREQIREKCPNVTNFVKEKKGRQERLKQDEKLGDKDIIAFCGKTLTVKSLLSLILHEMGYNFGLAKNLKASFDKENYWTKLELKSVFPNIEIDSEQELAKSSSVMDDLKTDQIAMDYLGKYDLAALRYLYFYEIEMKDGTIKNTAKELKDQQALTEETLKERKPYQYCLNKDLDSIMMCEAGDYGSNPKEIVQELILDFKRAFNLRYRYDTDESILKSMWGNFKSNLNKKLEKIKKYYEKWIILKDYYLVEQGNRSSYYALTEDSIDQYKTAIKNGYKKGNKEYDLYYPIREEVSNFIMTYFLAFDEMKCHIKENNTEYIISLEVIKDYLKLDNTYHYVEDCQSPQISTFFEENNLTFVKQTGYENFLNYYSYPETHEKFKNDVKSFKEIMRDLTKNISPLIAEMIQEPDKLHDFNLKMQNKIIRSFAENQISKETGWYNIRSYRDLVLPKLEKMMEDYPIREIAIQDYSYNLITIQYLLDRTKQKSFFEQVEKTLRDHDGADIEDVFLFLQIPFLESTYKKYLGDSSSQHTSPSIVNTNPAISSFQDYLLTREDVWNYNDKKMTIPYKEDSFIAQWFIINNMLKREKEKLAKKSEEDLSVLDKLKLIIFFRGKQ